VPATAAVALGGVIWCWHFQRSGGLLAPWISHLLVDAALMLVGYLLVWG
jgi:membrane protease YdiL (CAAX protease family)